MNKKRLKILVKRFKKRVNIKNDIVYRFFWGRSNLYKQSLHAILIIVTLLILVTGFSSSLFSKSSKASSLSARSDTIGDTDLLEQGGSIQTVLASTNSANFNVAQYTVKDGDTLDSIVTAYGVDKDTIKWANQDKIDYYKETVNPGDLLSIPEINGILYTVKDGDTLDSVLNTVQGSDRFQTIEINNLKAPDYKLEVGKKILVPNGKLPAPPNPDVYLPVQSIYRSDTPSDVILDPGTIVSALGDLNFIDPLSHPNCAGYGYSRGFSDWHNGVDLPKAYGCPIRAIEAGTVTYAGWSDNGEGYYVKINHGNGVESLYFHGDGNIWVQQGSYVSKGQDLMYMGCTGYCTGTHLHLSLRINGYFVDPSPYVPYYRPY